MALKRPPQHRVDAKPVFVSPKDDAWHTEKIDAEIARMEEKVPGSGRNHPVERYKSGESRYDIQAVLPYLDTDKAWQFELRPLDMYEFAEVQDLRARFGDWRGYLRAAELGIVKISGHGAPEDLATAAKHDVLIPLMVGTAAWLSSQPPTESEKKYTASGLVARPGAEDS